MRVYDTKTIRALDALAIKEYGIPGVLLMDTAAQALLDELDLGASYFVLVAGKGNNGGDAFALARKLWQRGKEVELFVTARREDYHGDAALFYAMVEKEEIPVTLIEDNADLGVFQEALREADWVVDALLGTGIKGQVSPFYRNLIKAINGCAKRVLSVDVPSGLCASEGVPKPVAVIARKTVTFEGYKKGFLNYDALPYLGEVVVCPVGIPEKAKASLDDKVFLLDEAMASILVPKRVVTGHKNEYGEVLVVAGSFGYTGAALLATEGALVSGAGLVRLSSEDAVLAMVMPRLTEAMGLPLEKIEEGVLKAQVVAFGPGLGTGREAYKLLLRVIQILQEMAGTKKVLLLDADGLNVLEGKTELLKSLSFPVIMTPHPGEMARLLGISKAEVEAHRLDYAKAFAKEHGVVLVLKGYQSIVTDGEEVYVNTTGTSAMAQGGMGDALTGIISAFIAQGLSPMKGAILGVYLHGLVGQELGKTHYSIKASDLLKGVPKALKSLQEKR
ncbi:MAG TPA: bifunctional ADP-dependent NAD(P)H-hydrate dehydratase/NAD(P)H-hydrate epimerase [Clostridiaceae bacterium]|nr:bifunctional ADP-dependent NAD(P)H-hydrate dehydratase/NAD(P)H-hydrate epimerase [Clostridiaceae bacterium]